MPLLLLALAFLVAYAWPVVDPNLDHDLTGFLAVLSWTVWGAFAIDFGIRLSLAEDLVGGETLLAGVAQGLVGQQDAGRAFPERLVVADAELPEPPGMRHRHAHRRRLAADPQEVEALLTSHPAVLE